MTAATSLGVAGLSGTAGAAPGGSAHQIAAASTTGQGKPTIGSVKQRLAALGKRNDQLVEKYNQAQIAYSKASKAAHQATHTWRKAEHSLAVARQQLGYSVTAEYEGGTFSRTGALLASSSGSNYLDQLDTMSMLSSHNAQVVANYTSAQKAAATAHHRAETLLIQARHTRKTLAARKRATANEISRYKRLLARLTAEQRRRLLEQSRSQATPAQVATATAEATSPAPTPTTRHVRRRASTAPSGAASIAVQFALAQVGKPYVWGAAGPYSYDCSGLTMASWAAAGVSLPHSAAEQYNYGTHVSLSDLEPGDLIFFYSPIGHVTIYIGNGLMVSAPQPGQDVMVVPLSYFSGDVVGATRLVG